MMVEQAFFVEEADRWLVDLTPYLSTCKIADVSLSALPRSTRRYMLTDHDTIDLDRIVEVAQWCLELTAWRAGLKHPSISSNVLTRMAFALMVDDGIGERLSRWYGACRALVAMGCDCRLRVN